MILRRYFLLLPIVVAAAVLYMAMNSAPASNDDALDPPTRVTYRPGGGKCVAKIGNDAVYVVVGAEVDIHGRSATCRLVDGHPVLIFSSGE
jgi:ABC-type Zn uptake system ZnuABC Zn-binding protein ZnuA